MRSPIRFVSSFVKLVVPVVAVSAMTGCSRSAISAGGTGGSTVLVSAGGAVGADVSADTGGTTSTGGGVSTGGNGSGGAAGTAGNGAHEGGSAGHDASPPDVGGLGPCVNAVVAPTIDACVQPVGGWSDGQAMGATRSIELNGTITAVTRGPIAGGCLKGSSDANTSIVVLTIEAGLDAGITPWDVEYQVPSSGLVWTLGTHVLVSYSTSGGGWSPEIVALTISYGQAVDVYIGKGGTVASLSKSPFAFRQGAAVCAQHDLCGDWSGYDLEVQDNDVWKRVPYGATTPLGGYRIIHGGAMQQTSGATSCADWYISSTRVAALRDGS